MTKPFPIPVRVRTNYSCKKCPAFCCTYGEIEVTPRDIERLARHFDVTYAVAEERYTKQDGKKEKRILRHRKDQIFDTACTMLDQDKRRCTVYDARPAVCRSFPTSSRCGYYEFLKFERAQQDDEAYVALT